MFWFYFSCRSGTFVKPDTVFITLRICRRRWGRNPKKLPPLPSPQSALACPARRSGAPTDPRCPPSGHVHPDPEAFFSPLPVAMGCSVCSPSASVENRVAVSRGPWGNLSISRTNDLGYGWFSQAF